jgi:hypothetical protein
MSMSIQTYTNRKCYNTTRGDSAARLAWALALAGHPFFLFAPMIHYFSHKEIKNRRKKCVKDVNSHARRKKKEK